MPVSRVLLEGELDIQVLSPVFEGNPVVDTRHSPKGSLAPRTRDLRQDQKVNACYVRDRDFDHFPPTDLTQPTLDAKDVTGGALGWRWCRHEIENYLIDPGLVAVALRWDKAAFEAELVLAAKTLLHYEAARWAAGQARLVMPPARKFPNKPAECTKDFHLPADLSEVASTGWVRDQASAYLANAEAALTPPVIEAAVADYAKKLNLAIQAGVPDILMWYSGKDLLSGLTQWLLTTHRLQPTDIRNRVRDWVVDNPDETLQQLPEWGALLKLLRDYP